MAISNVNITCDSELEPTRCNNYACKVKSTVNLLNKFTISVFTSTDSAFSLYLLTQTLNSHAHKHIQTHSHTHVREYHSTGCFKVFHTTGNHQQTQNNTHTCSLKHFLHFSSLEKAGT